MAQKKLKFDDSKNEQNKIYDDISNKVIKSPLWSVVESFGDYLITERFFSEKTRESYIRELKFFVEILIKQDSQITSWSSVTDVMVRNVIRSRSNLAKKEKSISNRTRAHFVSSLKSFYRYLVKTEQITQNFMLNIKVPKFKAALPEFLSYSQFEKLCELPENPSFKDIRDHAMIELLFASGIRVSELVGLTFNSVDWEQQELQVIGKGNKERYVPFGDHALQALLEWLAVRDIFKPICNNIFINRFGDVITTRAVEIILRKIGISENMPMHVTPHKLRHTFATEMLMGGADVRIVQELLGHSSVNTTQIYLNLDLKRLKVVYMKAHPLAIDEQQATNKDKEDQ